MAEPSVFVVESQTIPGVYYVSKSCFEKDSQLIWQPWKMYDPVRELMWISTNNIYGLQIMQQFRKYLTLNVEAYQSLPLVIWASDVSDRELKTDSGTAKKTSPSLSLSNATFMKQGHCSGRYQSLVVKQGSWLRTRNWTPYGGRWNAEYQCWFFDYTITQLALIRSVLRKLQHIKPR